MGKKLFKVTCRGMTYSIGVGCIHGIAYVVADNSDEAYKKLRTSLDKREIGFSKERELGTVELLAEVGEYPECGTALYD